jgi:hypothetical protein
MIVWLVPLSLIAAWFLVNFVRQASSPDPTTRYSGRYFPHFVLTSAPVYIPATLVASPGELAQPTRPMSARSPIRCQEWLTSRWARTASFPTWRWILGCWSF